MAPPLATSAEAPCLLVPSRARRADLGLLGLPVVDRKREAESNKRAWRPVPIDLRPQLLRERADQARVPTLAGGLRIIAHAIVGDGQHAPPLLVL